jgi:ABC-type multidrug transport system, ATPase and permease components
MFIVDDLVTKSGMTPHLWFLFFCELVLVVCTSVLKYISDLCNTRLRDHTQHALRLRINQQAATLDLDFFEMPGNYDTFAKAQSEIGVRPVMLVIALFSVLEDLITVAGFFIVVLAFQPILAIALVLAAVPAFIVSQGSSFLRYATHDMLTEEGRKAAYIDELLTKDIYAKEVRLYNLAPTFITWNKEYTHHRLSLLAKLALKASRRFGVADLFSVIIQCIGLLWVIYQTAIGNVSLGDFTLLAGAIEMVRLRLSGALTALGDVYENSLFISNLTTFLDLKPKLIAPDHPASVPSHITSGIRFENVSFAYAGSIRKVFDRLNLELRANEATALVGVNGAGKTTLVKLLSRLYDPTEGRITLDGIDIRQFDPDEYRRRIAVILQDFVRYQLSAKDNIVLGRAEEAPDEKQMREAAQKANVLEMVERFPEKWETMLGRQFHVRGQDLSGGQWQRMALARVLYRNAPILVLDEPTSALDAEAEAELFLQYRELTRGKLSLLITHRFNTVQEADRILVLEHGQILEDGTHETLLR